MLKGKIFFMKELLKVNQFLLFWVLFTIILFYGRPILIPIAFASMLAMLMAPVCRTLDLKGFHRALSATTCILILLVIFISAIWLIVAQVSSFREDMPLIEHKADSLLTSLQKTIEKRLDIPVEQQTKLMDQKRENLSERVIAYIRNFAGGIMGLIGGLAITLVVTFLLLYQKERYETFFKNYHGQE